MRQEQSRRIVDRFFAWCDGLVDYALDDTPLEGDRLRTHQRDALRRFLVVRGVVLRYLRAPRRTCHKRPWARRSSWAGEEARRGASQRSGEMRKRSSAALPAVLRADRREREPVRGPEEAQLAIRVDADHLVVEGEERALSSGLCELQGTTSFAPGLPNNAQTFSYSIQLSVRRRQGAGDRDCLGRGDRHRYPRAVKTKMSDYRRTRSRRRRPTARRLP